MAGLAIIFAGVLAFADKKLKVEEDPKVDEINHLLPGVNCGACGFLSCHDFAEHIVKDGADPAKCKVVAEEHRETIYNIAGKAGEEVHPEIPLICCSSKWENKQPAAEYKGVRTCSAANLNFGGGMKCQYGCIGFGDCTRVCPFDALKMEEGLPVVDLDKCTGCGKCAEACPRGIIALEEARNEKLFHVACSSHDNMLRVRQICSVGCIACGICEKLSQEGFFKVENDLSKADYSKQVEGNEETLRMLAGKCPPKVIKET